MRERERETSIFIIPLPFLINVRPTTEQQQPLVRSRPAIFGGKGGIAARESHHCATEKEREKIRGDRGGEGEDIKSGLGFGAESRAVATIDQPLRATRRLPSSSSPFDRNASPFCHAPLRCPTSRSSSLMRGVSATCTPLFPLALGKSSFLSHRIIFFVFKFTRFLPTGLEPMRSVDAFSDAAVDSVQGGELVKKM